jgi:hypothetical protein
MSKGFKQVSAVSDPVGRVQATMTYVDGAETAISLVPSSAAELITNTATYSVATGALKTFAPAAQVDPKLAAKDAISISVIIGAVSGIAGETRMRSSLFEPLSSVQLGALHDVVAYAISGAASGVVATAGLPTWTAVSGIPE